MRMPLVSVYVITYNHARYVAQAIGSILMQEADFPVELVIGEDCSTDDTRAICEQYARANPDRIRLLPSERNLGVQANARRTYTACRGKYIAQCEGDDYWTDPHKLQKQAAVLEKDPSLSFCFHNVEVVREGSSSAKGESFYPVDGRKALFARPSDRIGVSDILGGNFIPTASVLARADAVLPIPKWIDSLPAGDWGHFIHWLQQGAGAYLDELMGVYRLHKGGVWSGQETVQTYAMLAREMYILRQALGAKYQDRTNANLNKYIADFIRVAAGTLRVKAGTCNYHCLRQDARRLAVLCPESAVTDRRLVFLACEQLFLAASNAGKRRQAMKWLCMSVRSNPRYLLNRHVIRQILDLVRPGSSGDGR